MFNTETAADKPATERPPREQREAAANGALKSAIALLTDPLWLVMTLWRGRVRVFGCAIAGLVLAALASFLLPSKYISTAQLFIDPRDLRVLQNEVSPNSNAGDTAAVAGYLESQARVIASDTIKSRVIESERLDKDPEFGGENPNALSSLIAAFRPSSGGSRDGLLYALAEFDRRLSVRRGERTFVIDISVESQEPAKAARLANALANAYLDDQTQIRAEAAQRATGALTGRLEELRNRLRIAEEKTEKYKEANNIVGVGGRLIGEEQLQLNNAQLVALRTRVTEAKAKYDQTVSTRASAIEAGAIPEAVASGTMTALRSQLGAALSREADLLASLGDRHPALAAVRAQVRDARRQIAEELSRIASAAKAEYDRAVEAERQITRRVEQLTSTQYATGRASVELRELEREIESSRAVYDAFLRRARETGELAGIDTTNARIISYAMPPLTKSGLTRRGFAFAGGFGGGMLGALLVLALGLRSTLPATAAPAPALLAAPAPATPAQPPQAGSVLAFLRRRAPAFAPGHQDAAPSAPDKPAPRRLTAIAGGQQTGIGEVLKAASAPLLGTLPAVRHRRWRRAEGEVRSVFQSKTHLVDVLDKPGSDFTDAIATIRAALAAEAGEGRRVLVLGLRRQAGASTFALNLALDAALAGNATLLIDSGLGEAGLTPVYAPEAALGLQALATGEVGLVRAALQDEGTGLFFLPRIGRVDRLGAAEIAEGVFGAAQRFATVVVDGAALGSDGLTARFAEAVDDIVLVIREGEVGGADLDQLNTALGAEAAKIRGFVVNRA